MRWRCGRTIAEAHCNRGNALHELKRFEEALASHDRALALRPDYAEAHSNRGNALHELKRFERGAGELRPRARAAAGLMPRRIAIAATCLQDLKRFDEALASYDRALTLRPDPGRGASPIAAMPCKELERFDEALASYDRALVMRPDFADAHFNEACAGC